jgi:prepilin-type N-terminal cleavage/methylation domain-containing protein
MAPRWRRASVRSTERAHLRADPHHSDDARARSPLEAACMSYCHAPSTSRSGVTLVELCLVLTLVAILASIATRQVARYLDRAAARAAVAEGASVVLRARDEAMAQRTPVSVRFDTLAATLELSEQGVVLSRAALGHAHGVTLSSTRDSLTYDVRGLGYGAANLTMIVRRGAAAESLVVSRLGRVRW